MRALTLSAILLISTLSIAQEFPPPPAGKAAVYFFRTSAIGSAINFTFLDSAKVVGKFNELNYLRYECDPGPHLLWARSENRDFIEATLEGDKIYLIYAIPYLGLTKTAVGLKPIDWRDMKSIEKIRKLMERKPAKRWTNEELDEMTKDQAVIISRGLKQYWENKAKGSTFTQIRPDINFKKFELH